LQRLRDTKEKLSELEKICESIAENS
jgi:hypothetical protein